MADEKGLYILVTPSGSCLWKMKYRSPAGGERKLSFGAYPDVSLKVARGRRDEARRLLADGIDPADHKRQQERSAKIRAENSFLVVSEAYIAKNEREKLAPATIRKRRWHLELVKKKLGHLPIAEIQPIDVLEAVAAGRCEGSPWKGKSLYQSRASAAHPMDALVHSRR